MAITERILFLQTLKDARSRVSFEILRVIKRKKT